MVALAILSVQVTFDENRIVAAPYHACYR